MPSRVKDPLAERAEMERHQDVFCVVAGVPCQDVSVAGKRAGLKGERTGLFYEFARILRELRPAWFVFENVPGLLSSNDGRDFAEVQRVLMVECGYGLQWRVLNSQFFGVAQRRRRLFIVGSFGRPCPAEILFDAEGSEGDFAASAEEGAEIADESGSRVTPTLASEGDAHSGFRDEGGLAYCLRQDPGGIGQGHNTTFVSAPIDCGLAKSRHDQDGYPQHLVARTITGSAWKRHDEDTDTIIAIQGSGSSLGQRGGGWREGPMYTLNGVDEHAIAGTLGGRNRGDDIDRSGAFIGAETDSNGMRDVAGLPEGLDSPRYRALGNAVTVQVAEWIAKRMLATQLYEALGEASVK